MGNSCPLLGGKAVWPSQTWALTRPASGSGRSYRQRRCQTTTTVARLGLVGRVAPRTPSGADPSGARGATRPTLTLKVLGGCFQTAERGRPRPHQRPFNRQFSAISNGVALRGLAAPEDGRAPRPRAQRKMSLTMGPAGNNVQPMKPIVPHPAVGELRLGIITCVTQL